MRILIVDDDCNVRASLSNMIKILYPSYQVFGTSNGAEALRYLSDYVLDLVITDIRMRVMDGLDLSTYIRSNYPEVYIVFHSSYPKFEYAKQAIQSQAIDFMLKPVSIQQLNQLLLRVDTLIMQRNDMDAISQLRRKDLLEKRMQDLLYELPIPYFDSSLLPEHRNIFLVSLTTGNHDLSGQAVRFAVKNIMNDWLSMYGQVVTIAEKQAVTAVVFSDLEHITATDALVQELIPVMQNLMKKPVKVVGSETITCLEDIGDCYRSNMEQLDLHIYSEPDATDTQVHNMGSVHHLIRSALEMIEEKYDDHEITLASIADALYVNPNYLSTLFKQELGENFSVYLQRKRIARAKELLLETHMKIYEICMTLGYSDPAYFSKLFKNTEGLTPYQYRELNA